MSQPDPNPPAPDGASALLAAAQKSDGGPRRKRYVPKAKDPKGGAPAPVSDTAPQVPAEAPEPVPAAQDTVEPVSVPQEPSQAEERQPEAPAAPEPPAAPPEAPAPPGETPTGGTNSTTDVGFPATPLRFESVFTRSTHSMDPEMFAMFKQRQEKILKSLANIVTMFLDRKEEYEKAVRTAIAADFPKDELVKLAVQYDSLPFLEAFLGEQLSQ